MLKQRSGPGAAVTATEAKHDETFGILNCDRDGQAGGSGEGVVLRRWRPDARRSLVGFADIELVPFGLQIDSVAVQKASNGTVWVCMPALPVLDKTGRQLRGKGGWTAQFHWSAPEHRQRFQDAVIAAIRERYPFALVNPGETR
jgi:hypothetical protein